MIELESRITAVNVFRDGARVTRTGRLKLEPGAEKIVIRGITDRAHQDSFRVKGQGPAMIAGIDTRSTHIVYKPQGNAKPLLEELKNLEEERREFADEMELLKARLGNVDTIMTEFSNHFGMVYAADETTIDQLSKIDKSTQKLYTETKKKLRNLDERLKENSDRIAVIRKNLGEIEAERRTEYFNEVEISLEATKRGEIELEVTYQCDGAWWTPGYDVDLFSNNAKLRRIAHVYNQTREAWNDVHLVVSTATAKPVEAVEPTPFWISAYDPTAVSRRRGLGRAAPKMKKASKPEAAPPPAPSMAVAGMAAPEPEPEIIEEFADASETESGITLYELPNPVTIPDDDESHPVTLIEEDLSSKTIHYWYADGMAEVIAEDEVVNNDTVILPGDMKVFSEGDYIGETRIGKISPREKFKLGARTAYSVKATKKLIEREAEKAGIVRGKLKRGYKYQLEIKNFDKKEISIEVFDRIPHSVSTSIEVKADWEHYGTKKHELGVLEWHKKIQPDSKLEIEYAYEVVWESGVSIHPILP